MGLLKTSWNHYVSGEEESVERPGGMYRQLLSLDQLNKLELKLTSVDNLN